MKKLLLSFALIAAGTSSMCAQEFSDFFTIKYDGKEYSDGQTIHINKYEDFIPGKSISYSQHIEIINKEDQPRNLQALLNYAGKPTREEALADPAFWSEPSLCHTEFYGGPGNCLGPTEGNLGTGTITVFPSSDSKTFAWDMHLYNVSPEADSTYSLQMYAMDIDEPEDIAASCKIYINFSTKEDTAVDEIGVSDEAPVYYNLQGVRTDKPADGLYIRVQGGKVSKVLVK